jgi:hypothetical protein
MVPGVAVAEFSVVGALLAVGDGDRGHDALSRG